MVNTLLCLIAFLLTGIAKMLAARFGYVVTYPNLDVLSVFLLFGFVLSFVFELYGLLDGLRLEDKE